MKITPDVASELWDQTPHDWTGFRDILQNGDGRMSNLTGNDRQELISFSRDMERQGESFPTSQERLFHLLANRLNSPSAPSPGR